MLVVNHTIYAPVLTVTDHEELSGCEILCAPYVETEQAAVTAVYLQYVNWMTEYCEGDEIMEIAGDHTKLTVRQLQEFFVNVAMEYRMGFSFSINKQNLNLVFGQIEGYTWDGKTMS